MSNRLRHYLVEIYEGRKDFSFRMIGKDFPIKIDDQDDDDNINEFCNIFITVGNGNQFEIELNGAIPVTKEISDLADIYNGYADAEHGIVVLNLNPNQIEVLVDLASSIRATAFMGDLAGNPNWDRISARAISSLNRFVRIIRDYNKQRGGRL